MAYFYFDFNDEKKQQYGRMLRSLILQLVRCREAVPAAIESLYSSCARGSTQPADGPLLDVLKDIIQGFDKIFIVLDAMDECQKRYELLGALEIICSWELQNLHLLATSRKEKDITDTLNALVQDSNKIMVQGSSVNDDIRAYVRSRLQNDHCLRRWQKQSKVQDEIEIRIMEKVDGM